MANTINFTCRIESDVKQKGEILFKELGMSLSTAINVFLKESIRKGERHSGCLVIWVANGKTL